MKITIGESSTFGASISKVDAETKGRFVIFLDIMGFKDRVARHGHNEILKGLQDLSNFVSEEINARDKFQFTMFSDSIIIFSEDKSNSTFKEMIKLANSVVKRSIAIGLPIKGAMACGDCTVRFGVKPLFFGQPIIDAYCLEENLEMYNMVLHNTVETYATTLVREEKNLLFDCLVKLKGGNSKHYVLSWFASSLDECKKNLQAIRVDVSDAPRRYIDNTFKCISAFENPNDLVKEDTNP